MFVWVRRGRVEWMGRGAMMGELVDWRTDGGGGLDYRTKVIGELMADAPRRHQYLGYWEW